MNNHKGNGKPSCAVKSHKIMFPDTTLLQNENGYKQETALLIYCTISLTHDWFERRISMIISANSRLADWLNDWLIVQLTEWFNGLPVIWLTKEFSDSMVGWLNYSVIYWLAAWMIELLIGWPPKLLSKPRLTQLLTCINLLSIVSCRPVAKLWFCKQRPLLGNSS
jgi:hypothetical protein